MANSQKELEQLKKKINEGLKYRSKEFKSKPNLGVIYDDKGRGENKKLIKRVEELENHISIIYKLLDKLFDKDSDEHYEIKAEQYEINERKKK